MDDLWHIGFSSWIIADGNYDNFAMGVECDFALEFCAQKIDVEAASQPQPRCAWVKDSFYDVIGRVAFRSKDAWVLDFGIQAYREGKPPAGARVGDCVAAEIGLGIDPYPYFEQLHAVPAMPPLIYTWTVERILLETGPLVERVDPKIGKVLMRDETKRGYKEVDSTGGYHAESCALGDEYLLECRLQAVAPKRTSRTAK
jgi:hypothetical protein